MVSYSLYFNILTLKHQQSASIPSAALKSSYHHLQVPHQQMLQVCFTSKRTQGKWLQKYITQSSGILYFELWIGERSKRVLLMTYMTDLPTLTVWPVNSHSHDLASKSHDESENLEIAEQFQ